MGKCKLPRIASQVSLLLAPGLSFLPIVLGFIDGLSGGALLSRRSVSDFSGITEKAVAGSAELGPGLSQRIPLPTLASLLRCVGYIGD